MSATWHELLNAEFVYAGYQFQSIQRRIGAIICRHGPFELPVSRWSSRRLRPPAGAARRGHWHLLVTAGFRFGGSRDGLAWQLLLVALLELEIVKVAIKGTFRLNCMMFK